MAKIKIRQPRAKNDKDYPMPQTFVAAGYVKLKVKAVKVKSVTATITDENGVAVVNGAGKVIHLKLDRLEGRPGWANRLRWIAFFKNVPDTPVGKKYTLTVQAVDGADAPIAGATDTAKFVVKAGGAKLVPSIDFPSPNYEITGDELGYFVVFGASNSSLASCALGPKGADATDWDPGENFWWAEFYDLSANPGSGDYSLVTVNATGPNSVDVDIE